jgi:hypothetical protein
MTQVPNKGIRHSDDGLINADGNSAYGTQFTLVGYFVQTASGTTTVTFCTADAPYKFRVLNGEVECMEDARGRTELGNGRSSVNVMAGSTNTVASLNVTGLRQGEKRSLKVNTLGNEVVAVDGSLSAAVVSVLPEVATSSNWKLLVKLHCLRVI